MSTRVESSPIRGSFNGPIVIAIIVALGIGISAGTVITKAVDDRPAAVATPIGAQLWDAPKLEAMEGRAMAEQFRVDAAAPIVANAKPSSTRRPLQQGWDAYKLEAMAGRVLAAAVGAEDPSVKPHMPKRSPTG